MSQQTTEESMERDLDTLNIDTENSDSMFIQYDEDDLLKDQNSQDPNNGKMEEEKTKDADDSAQASNPATVGETQGEVSSSAPPSSATESVDANYTNGAETERAEPDKDEPMDNPEDEEARKQRKNEKYKRHCQRQKERKKAAASGEASSQSSEARTQNSASTPVPTGNSAKRGRESASSSNSDSKSSAKRSVTFELQPKRLANAFQQVKAETPRISIGSNPGTSGYTPRVTSGEPPVKLNDLRSFINGRKQSDNAQLKYEYVKDWNEQDTELPQPKKTLTDRLNEIRQGGNGSRENPVQASNPRNLHPHARALRSVDCLVIRKPYGYAISRREFEELNFLLNTWLDEIPRDAPFPIFNRTNLAHGRVYVECADEISVEWISSSIPRIAANWAHGELLAHSKNDFYNLRKAVINLPWDPNCNLGPEHVFLRLERANHGLDTKHWHFIKHEDQEPNRRILVLRIDNASVLYITGQNNILHYQLGTVTVIIYRAQAGNSNE
jgi:hypothetical protein